MIVGKATVVNIFVTVAAATSAAIVVNIFTDSPGWTIAALVTIVAVSQVGIMYLGEVLRQREARNDRGALLASLRSALPFSRSARTRAEAIRILRADLQARRVARLRPLVPDERLDEVLEWMRHAPDPPIEVPAGHLRVLVGPMGAGKTEHALRWLEIGAMNAEVDNYVEVPIWLNARDASLGLQMAIHTNLGRDAYRPCRVVIDDLDSPGFVEAKHTLDEARQLVRVWPNLAILMTSRPALNLTDSEMLVIKPWASERGVDLARLVLDRDLPHEVWSRETSDLFTAPLLALAMAKRIGAGGASPTSRIDLLSGITGDILREERPNNVDVGAWTNLARLAGRILNSGEPIRSTKFGNEAEIWAMTETKLVIEDKGNLGFALPIFEQHFGAQALQTGVVRMEDASGPASFPRWRYAIALTFSEAEPEVADQMFADLASNNAAAASWILDELAHKTDDLNHRISIEPNLISLNGHSLMITDAASISITAGTWLRGAMEAFLLGFGPVAPKLAQHHEGTLVRWGFSLRERYAILATAIDTLPPPAVVEVSGTFDEISLADGWKRIRSFGFPSQEHGRWIWARDELRDSLGNLLRKRTLPVSPGTAIDRERLLRMAKAVTRFGPGTRFDPTDVDRLRVRTADLMAQVHESTWATWSGSGHSFDSDDVRWLDARLASVADCDLKGSWPEPDRNDHLTARWQWQRYSPELLIQTSEKIIFDAILGYQDLVATNFPQLGDSLGLYSIRPIRFDGLLNVPEDANQHAPWLFYTLSKDDEPSADGPTVNLRPYTNSSADSELESMRQRSLKHGSVFYTLMQRGTVWPIGGPYAVTDLAYSWLIHDLEALGLLKKHFRI